MREWRTRLATAPPWVLFLYFTISFGLLTFLLGLGTGSRTHWLGSLIGGLFFGAAMTAFIGWRRQRDGGVENQLAFRDALKRSELPPDAEPADWGPLLEQKKRTYRLATGIAMVVSSRRYVGRIERMQRQLGAGSASDPIGP